MELKAIENRKETLKLEIGEESHSLLNLLREKAWTSGAKDASYFVEHPYLSEPRIIIRSKNPKSTLNNATQLVIDQATEFEREFKRATKK